MTEQGHLTQHQLNRHSDQTVNYGASDPWTKGEKIGDPTKDSMANNPDRVRQAQ